MDPLSRKESMVFPSASVAAQPADLSAAREFRDETCLRKLSDGAFTKYPIFSTPLSEIGEYGTGLELYFTLTKYLFCLFFIISLISIPPIYYNSEGSGLTAGDVRQRWDTWNVANTDEVLTEDDLDTNKSSLSKLYICDAIYSSLFIIFIVLFQIKSNRIIQKNLDKNITLADYSVEVTGLPEAGFTFIDVRNHFSQFGTVFEVFLARRYNGILTAYRKRAELTKQILYLNELAKRGVNKDKKIQEVKAKIHKLDEQIKENETNSDATHDDLPVVMAFVVFQEIKAKKDCLNRYAKSYGCCRRLRNQPVTLKFQEIYPLVVDKTADPSSILYENLEISKCSAFLRRIISLICVLLAIIVSIAMIYGLKLYQDDLPSSSDCADIDGSKSLEYAKSHYIDDVPTYCYCKKQSLSDIINNSSTFNYCSYFLERISKTVALRIGVSIGVIIVNLIIKIIFRHLTRFERHKSRSEEQFKLMSKVFIATFINTALVILAVNADFSDLKTYSWLPEFIFNSSFSDFSRSWYVQVGSTLVSTMLVTIFTPHVVLLMTVYPLGLCKRHCCTNRFITQYEANYKFSGAEFDLATRNSVVLTSVFTCFLYSGGMPIMNVICCLTMFLLYWTDKFLILRHYKKPPLFNHLFHERVLHYLPFAVIFHCGFSLYMYGASDLFPKEIYTDYSYKVNSILDRIGSTEGAVFIIIAVVSVLAFVWVYFYAIVFAYFMRKKIFSIKDDKDAEETINKELVNIRAHGLDTYDISAHLEYTDLIIEMNMAADNLRKSRSFSKITVDNKSN